MRRIPRRAMDTLLGGLEVRVLGLEDVGYVLLRIAVDQGEPCALHLDHDLVPLAEAVVAPVQIELVLVYLVGRYRLRLLEALAEPGPNRLAADEELVAAHAR